MLYVLTAIASPLACLAVALWWVDRRARAQSRRWQAELRAMREPTEETRRDE